MTQPVPLRLAARLYGLTVRLCTPAFVAWCGADLQQTFADKCATAWRRGRVVALPPVLIAELWDLVRVAVRQRLARRGLIAPLAITVAGEPRPPQRSKRGVFRMVLDDLRHALRRLRSQPATAILAAAMLALAIGISSAMFTMIDSLILRPAPFKDIATLVWLGIGKDEKANDVNLSPAMVTALRGSPAFKAVFGVVQEPVTFGTGETAETARCVRVTQGLFEELGVAPLFGRTFVAGEGRAGDDDQILIGESVWRSRFAADPAIVGRRIDVSGASLVVVGVMPGRFAFPFANTYLWRPLDLDQPPPSVARRSFVFAYARLAANLPRADAARVASDVAHLVDPATAGLPVQFGSIGGRFLDDYSANTLKVLSAGVALVFLVLCANVTNLMLARLSARQREFALSSALGASRGRLLRQAVAEQLVIGAAAAAAGLAIGASLVTIARAYLPDDIVGRTLNPVEIDLRAVLGTSIFGALAIVIAGLLPAWIGTSERASRGLQVASRSATTSRRARATSRALLVGEIAFAVALSVAAGLQLRSFVNLLHEDRGLDADHLVTFGLGLPAANFADGASRYAYAETLRSSVVGRPGVDGVVLSQGALPSGGDLHFYGVTPDTPGAAPVRLVMHGYFVAPGFFETYGIRLLEGRGFEPGDPPETAVISRTMAGKLWPGQPALGHTFKFGRGAYRVIGVANEIRNSLNDPRSDDPELYQPLLTPGAPGSPASAIASTSVTLSIRCGSGCPPLDQLRADLKAAAPRATVGAGKRIADGYFSALARPRSGAVVAIVFAAIGLIAVGGGLFAVLSRVVQQRQREFGIRAALGATPADLRRLVHASGLGVAAMGLGVGMAIAWALSRVLVSVQYQVRADDPLTWIIVIGTVTLTVLLASWRPARVAMRTDPLRLLREE